MHAKKGTVLNTVRLSSTEIEEYLLSEYLKDSKDHGSMQLTILLLKKEKSAKPNTEKNYSTARKKNVCAKPGYVIQTLTYPLNSHTEGKGTSRSRGKK